ncbi:Glycoside hydrolase, catalytic domain-containing protein [Artemisia annua]|uniref:Glycoside hydrolase, catalytic domain-containing protein n=1 Tax=Artemisia annua TaxID=35608 RepID=A0A2U1MX57_ARTAN|nr:Glycoside hydrolase, catalytic domain-containing protein [Artemisia annua]
MFDEELEKVFGDNPYRSGFGRIPQYGLFEEELTAVALHISWVAAVTSLNFLQIFTEGVLQALSGSDIDVTVGVPNDMLKVLNGSVKAAQSWVHDNLTRYVTGGGKTRVEYIAVGDEPFLQTYGSQFYPHVVGAAINIEAALIRAKLATKVKIVIPCSFDAFQSDSGRPSTGHFRSDINKTMVQVLNFLTKTRSPFFANISPFLSYYQNKNISLDFALFKENAHPHNDSHKSYKNAFELSYDTLVTALTDAGFPQIDIVISQIGWPTDGAPNATVTNANTFTKGLLNHLRDKKGTPLRPRAMPLETYIYSLFDEDQRSITGGTFERHWGLFTFDGQIKYQVDFSQSTKRVVNAQNVEYLASKWCVVNNNINMSNATARATEACTKADCTALSPGSSCFNLSWPGNVSYAFNSYYQQHDQRADSCDFGGLGMITTVDPSVGSCRFNVELKPSFSVSLHGSTFDYPLISIVLTTTLCKRPTDFDQLYYMPVFCFELLCCKFLLETYGAEKKLTFLIKRSCKGAATAYGGSDSSYPQPPSSYGANPSYGTDAVPPPASYNGGPTSYPPSYGGGATGYAGDSLPDNRGGARGGSTGGYGAPAPQGQGGYGSAPAPQSQGGYGGAPAEAPAKVKQCDETCGLSCDNARIYISNLPPDVTTDELRELFGGIGQVARIKQKRGYKDQWPYNIKLYTDDSGKNKGDGVLVYEDPSAAHSAGGFFNDYELRGYKISVGMAEKSAPRPPPAYGQGGGGGRGGGGYGGGGDRRRDNYRDGGPDRNSHGGNRSRPY